MKKLSGLAGCKRMAQDILRADREAARDAYVDGGKKKKDNPSVSGIDMCRSRLRSAAPWARRFLPGSKESGSTLPASTTRVGLTRPPKRHSWVAQYRNVLLQAQRKRPTRSKSYRAGRVPEHRAFQMTLAMVCGGGHDFVL